MVEISPLKQLMGLFEGLSEDKKNNPEEFRDRYEYRTIQSYSDPGGIQESRRTIRLGKNTMPFLRKCAYNIARLLQMENPERRGGIPDIIDDVCDNLEIGLQMIFSPIPSRY